MPPSTTIARISADSPKFTDSGLMKPCRAVKKAPAKPPNNAPIAKAVSLLLVVLMPSDAAGDLVLAQRLPGASDRQPAQPVDDDGGEHDRAQHDVIEKHQAMQR